MRGTKESLIVYEKTMSEAKEKMINHMKMKSNFDEERKGSLDLPTITPASRGNKRSTYFWENGAKRNNPHGNCVDMTDPPMKKPKGRPKKSDEMAEV